MARLPRKKHRRRTSQRTLGSLLLKRPQTNCRVVASSSEPGIVRAEAEPTNRFSVTRPLRQIIHVRLEVLDDAALVRRCKERAGVRELHRADSGVMRLQDSLEVERQAVP